MFNVEKALKKLDEISSRIAIGNMSWERWREILLAGCEEPHKPKCDYCYDSGVDVNCYPCQKCSAIKKDDKPSEFGSCTTCGEVHNGMCKPSEFVSIPRDVAERYIKSSGSLGAYSARKAMYEAIKQALKGQE